MQFPSSTIIITAFTAGSAYHHITCSKQTLLEDADSKAYTALRNTDAALIVRAYKFDLLTVHRSFFMNIPFYKIIS